MRVKPALLGALSFGASVSVLAVACQSYDFEKVDPVFLAQTTVEVTLHARDSKPNIMLLVDTSGSMTLPVDESDPDCRVLYNNEQVICGNSDEVPCNTAVCPTRWTELQAAVPGFLASAGPHVRLGLTTYPDTNGERGLEAFCRPSSSRTVQKDLPEAEDDASLLEHANKINNIIQAIPNSGAGRPVGGTPTSLSLRFVKDLPGFQDKDRKQFVVLLTDGVPNCNPDNVYQGSDAECRCTTESGCGPTQTGRRGCLDKDASVSAVRELRAAGIRTIVIGFGAETAAGDGPAVLEAMAQYGDFPRTCKDGQTSCGPGDACDPVTNLCQRSYYQAANKEELAQALEDISKDVLGDEPCLIKLEPSELPSAPSLIVVYVDGERTAAGEGTWTLGEDGVRFNGAMCERILASTPDAPVDIEVRAIRQR